MYNDPTTTNQPSNAIDATQAPLAEQSALDTQDTMDGTAGMGQFYEGTPVYDVNGAKVGTVSEHGVQDNALVIHHGLLRDDVYIPLSVIDSKDADGVYLSISKDDALSGVALDTMDDTTQTAGTVSVAGGTLTDQADVLETDQMTVPVRQEELVVGKQQEEIGRVHLSKDVIEEEQTITAPVTREEVRVERVPVQGQVSADTLADAFTEKDIDVPVMGEELVAGKRTVVNEEVRVSKQAVTEQQQVSDTVRKERVTVEGANEVYGADATLKGVEQIDDTDTVIEETPSIQTGGAIRANRSTDTPS